MRSRVELRRRTNKWPERLFIAVCWLALLTPLAMLAVLVGDVLIDGLGRINGQFLTGHSSPSAARSGIWPALIGSLYLMGITLVLAVPIGVATAVYLEEYGKRSRLASLIEINISNLAGVPSVIFGLLGLGLFVRALALGSSVLAGGATLALLVLPVVIMASREALRTVPSGLREAALALGATRWQMIRRVVLPMAAPGVLTGTILAISRAIGESAPLIVVGAVAFISFTPDGLGSAFTALPIQIFNWTSMPQKAFLTNAAAGIVVLLIALVAINSVAIYLRNKYQVRASE